MAQKQYLVINDLRGGRNGADAPLALPDRQCVEALNVDWHEGTLAHKRFGAESVFTGPGATGTAFASYLSTLLTASYQYSDYPFAIDGSTPAIVNYYDNVYGGWTAVNSGDTILTAPYAVNAVTFNDRTYFCFDSAVNRLHFWVNDATFGRNMFHRVGIPAPAAPTVANYGSGSYTATLRYYKIAWIYKDGSDILNRSELSEATSFTPSGSGTSARVSMPADPALEKINYWEVYGSADGDVYRLLSTLAVDILTNTYDDSTAPADYDGDLAPVVGTNSVPGSWKYIASTGNRLIGMGNWETGQQSRVWFTPIYGASDIGDCERVPTSNYIDLDAYDGDPGMGLIGSFMGNTLVFKRKSIWRLVPTGDDVAPFAAVCLTKAIGCVAPKSIVIGENESGAPAVYFMSHRGPYRLGTNGLEYCGRDIEDVIATMNSSATVICHAIWHPRKHQVWFHVATGSNLYPNERVVLDTHLCRSTSEGVREGWSRQSGSSCTARCSANFGYPLNVSGGLYTYPYIGSSATVNSLLRCDVEGVYQDAGESFRAYVKTKPYALGGLGFNCGVSQSHLTASAEEGVTITQEIDRDYGVEVRTAICSLTARGHETRVQRQFEGSDCQGAGVVQFQLGDEVAAGNAWTLDALVVPYTKQEER